MISKEQLDICLGAIDRLNGNHNVLQTNAGHDVEKFSETERNAFKEVAKWLQTFETDGFSSVGPSGSEEQELSETTRNYLQAFRDQYAPNQPVDRGQQLGKDFGLLSPDSTVNSKGSTYGRSFRKIAMAAWLVQVSQPKCSEELQEEMAKLYDWDSFDVLKIARLTRGSPLEAVGMSLMSKYQLLEKLAIPETCLRNFLRDVEAAYHASNPYHNSMHAADVTQSLGCILDQDDFKQHMTELEVAAMILAAIVHDLGHPGYNNDFLIKTQADVAVVYNDNSVNENHHLATAFRLLQKHENDIFQNLERQQYMFIRRAMIDIVLSTDMAQHSDLMKQLNTTIALQPADFSQWDDNARGLAMQVIVHCADISNPAKPARLAGEWARRVMEEFLHQGEVERRLGLAVTPLFDRDKVNVALSQAAFLEYVVKPGFEAIEGFAPNTCKKAMVWVNKNLEMWTTLQEAGDPFAVIGDVDGITCDTQGKVIMHDSMGQQREGSEAAKLPSLPSALTGKQEEDQDEEQKEQENET